MAMYARHRTALIVWGAIIVVVVISLVVTPIRVWIGGGMSQLGLGITRLPGVAWAREQMRTASPSGEAASQSGASSGSERINAILRTGRQMQEEGALEEALKQYQEALDLDTEYLPTRLALASLYLETGRQEDALREFERAAELAPDDAAIQAQLGRLYLELDFYERSVEALQRAKELESENTTIRYLLGMAYYYRSHVDAQNAVTEMEKAVELAPDDPDVRYYLAMVYVRRDGEGDGDRAISALEKVVALDPSRAEAYFHLGRLYIQAGQRDAAITAWRQYVSMGDDPEMVAQVRVWLQNIEEQ